MIRCNNCKHEYKGNITYTPFYKIRIDYGICPECKTVYFEYDIKIEPDNSEESGILRFANYDTL
jgi:hypothetical protein